MSSYQHNNGAAARPALQIKKATRTDSPLRMALIGVSGSGKTWTALAIATSLAEGGPILVVDTEHQSASKYAKGRDGSGFEFDTIQLEDFDPRAYIECINMAAANGYKVVILDSLSHAWSGKGGALEMVDNAGKRSNSGNSFAAWKDVTPIHNQLIDAMVRTPIHLIATMRAKTEYIIEQNERGKSAPRKVGTSPDQRQGMEYEFDVVGDINDKHELHVTKSRCSALADAFIPNPGDNVASILKDWLAGGAPVAPVIQTQAKPGSDLADSALLAQAESIRQVAVKLGYRTDRGEEPKPLGEGLPATVVIARMAKWDEYVQNGAPTPPEPAKTRAKAQEPTPEPAKPAKPAAKAPAPAANGGVPMPLPIELEQYAALCAEAGPWGVGVNAMSATATKKELDNARQFVADAIKKAQVAAGMPRLEIMVSSEFKGMLQAMRDAGLSLGSPDDVRRFDSATSAYDSSCPLLRDAILEDIVAWTELIDASDLIW